MSLVNSSEGVKQEFYKWMDRKKTTLLVIHIVLSSLLIQRIQSRRFQIKRDESHVSSYFWTRLHVTTDFGNADMKRLFISCNSFLLGWFDVNRAIKESFLLANFVATGQAAGLFRRRFPRMTHFRQTPTES